MLTDSLEIGISQTDINASLSFHVALADLLQLVGRTADAMEHYNAALRLDGSFIWLMHTPTPDSPE